MNAAPTRRFVLSWVDPPGSAKGTGRDCRGRSRTRAPQELMRLKPEPGWPSGDCAIAGSAAVADVGSAYLDARSDAHDPLVVAAYARLQTETDRLFADAVDRAQPVPVRIAFTRCREPYQSDRELIEAFHSSGVLEITTAATNSGRIHPLLGCEYGGAFDRFRAVHDLIGHARAKFGFALPDEVAAWRVQDRLHSALARRALATELLAINSARALLGEPPQQNAVLLEPGLLGRARRHRGTIPRTSAI
jgi:hypothetical protein